MNRISVKRVVSVLLGMVLPVGIVVALLAVSMQRSYLQAADSFGVEFGQAMVEQARAGVKLATSENWNTVNMASAAVPAGFVDLPATEQVQWLESIASSGEGRYNTYFFYEQSGDYAASDGTSGSMHYTGRTDISEVLSGSVTEAIYGPVFEDDVENETTGVSTADNQNERGGYEIYFTVPVKNAAGTVVGAISLRRDAYQYSDVISSLNLGKGGYTCLIDADGTVLAASRSEYLSLVAEEMNLTTLTGAYGAAAKEAIAGKSGAEKSVDTQLGNATVLYAPMAETAASEAADGATDLTAGVATATDMDVTDTWSVLCYLPTSDLEGFMTSEADRDMTGSLTTRLAVLLLVCLGIFYVAWDAYRFTRSESTRAAREHKDVLDQTLRAMAAAAESRNVPNKGHGYRVAAYAREIGKHLDLDEAQEQNLYFEAALHDIGMLAVSEEILQHDAENKLTADEARRLNEHATIGGRILGRLTALPGINAGAMYHHQHYDGGGYCSTDVNPQKGDDIPLAARIITVADAYDVQAGMGRTNVDEMLEKGKGGKYDPMIADIMIQLIHDGTIEKLTRETDRTMRSDSAELAEV